MKLSPAMLSLALIPRSPHIISIADALVSNPEETPQVLSDATSLWSASQGRTSNVHSAGVIGIYPQDEDGWNTGPKESNSCDWDDFSCTSDPDEGAFVASIIVELRDQRAKGNVYLIGSSNGAALAMRLASNAGDDLPIKGIVTIAMQLLGSLPRSGSGDLNYNQPASGGPPVSVLNIMGTADTVIPYTGGSVLVGRRRRRFRLMTVLESMSTWAEHEGCDGNFTTSLVSYSASADPNGEATFYEYGGCPEGIIVEHYAVIGARHSFGPQSALDGVAIDYDLAYDFIDRLEGADSGGGGGDGPCADDPAWASKFNSAHDCSHVAEAPEM
ncbi:hypothetical protein ACHAWF_012378, partial [Thalassiosira exigua]